MKKELNGVSYDDMLKRKAAETDEIRFKHAVMEYDHEIEYCKQVLDSDAPKDAKQDAQTRLESAEKHKANLLASRKK